MFFRSKWKREANHTTFDEINVNEFYNTSFRYVFGYICMWGGILIAIAVLASDFYTAIVLLAFDRWSSNIQPKVPFHISRWIFGGCIILSVVLIIYNFIRAYMVAKTRNISFTYTNSIARDCLSIRDYNYFCLFAKITKSKSKVEYLALFVYFSLKGWMFLLITDAPRQVINALTLYSVLKVQDNFIKTVKKLGEEHLTEAIVMGFMAFSLFIWVIRMISFITALLCCLPLYVHIEKSCSGLEEYCCTRIDRRIAKLVDKKHKKGMAQLREENKKLRYQPTIPSFVIGPNEANDYDSIRKGASSFTTQNSTSTLMDNTLFNSKGVATGRRDSFSSVVSSSSDNSQSNLLPSKTNPYTPRKPSIPLPDLENRYQSFINQTRRPSDGTNRYASSTSTRNPYAVPPPVDGPMYGINRPTTRIASSVYDTRTLTSIGSTTPSTILASNVPFGTPRLASGENLPTGLSAQFSRNTPDLNDFSFTPATPLQPAPTEEMDPMNYTAPPPRAAGHNLQNTPLFEPAKSSEVSRNGTLKMDPNGRLREPRVPSLAAWDVDEN